MAAAAAETDEDDDEENVALVVDKKRVEALQERRCDSRGRGGVYDPVLGICCHFCRYTRNLAPLTTFVTDLCYLSCYHAELASSCK